jgi:soluble lytic murein transglycosylase-like protein
MARICADFYAEQYGVPAELVHAIIEVESGWNPYAVSSKEAVGVMQLMPTTAAAFGVRNRFKIEENVAAGVAYLSWLCFRFRGDFRLVAAAYFAGEERISRWRLNYNSPEVCRYVAQVARVYRRERLETLRTQP